MINQFETKEKIMKKNKKNLPANKKIHPLVNAAIIVQTIVWVIGLIYFDSARNILAILYAMLTAVNIIFLIEKKYFIVPTTIQTIHWAGILLLVLLGHLHRDYMIIASPLLILNIFALAKIWGAKWKK